MLTIDDLKLRCFVQRRDAAAWMIMIAHWRGRL